MQNINNSANFEYGVRHAEALSQREVSAAQNDFNFDEPSLSAKSKKSFKTPSKTAGKVQVLDLRDEDIDKGHQIIKDQTMIENEYR